jgi:ParB family transcriptional regulator, chromosome partitioning protein
MVMPPPPPKPRLGRGLASLIGEAPPMAAKVLPNHGEQKMVLLEQIRPSTQNPRKNFSETELDELAASIREKGLVQPIIVRPLDVGVGYEIVAGERRWRAAQRAAQHTVPVIIRKLNDQEALELAIIENVQRTDLNAIEEATGYRDLIEKFKYTQDELAQIIGKSRSHLANTLRLLKLPDSVQEFVRNGQLSAGHARAMIGREDAETVAQEVVKKGMNVRDVEALFSARKAGGDGPGKTPSNNGPTKDADTRAVERELSDALGLAVAITPGSGEKGEIIIRYRSLDQFEVVRKRLLAE